MKLGIKNFRSIAKQEIKIAPITVIYGPNGTGKSSILYALLTLKNIILNPQQETNSFFNYGFANLGGFEAVVFDHKSKEKIELEISSESPLPVMVGDIVFTYKITIFKNSGGFFLSVGDDIKVNLELPISFPYSLNQQTQQEISYNQNPFVVIWNGITAQIQPKVQNQEAQQMAIRLATIFNTFPEIIRKVDIISLKRGFSKPYYSTTPVSPMIITEDEVASLLANDKYLVSKVSFYLEQILNRDFRVNFRPGTAMFSLDSIDKKTGVSAELVNDGFGVNQIVYLLAKCLYDDTNIICVEEPEIHLHPTGVRELAKALVKISKEEKKHFIVSTHSESFLLALLTLVAKGNLRPSDLSCYLVQKKGRATQLEQQFVDKKGGIEGGLTSFIEGELEDIKDFLKVPK